MSNIAHKSGINQNFGVLIGNKSYNLDDQLQFAKFTGDFNPIHVDPILARRTISGECIVHGINGLMYAIECLVKFNGMTCTNFEVRFIKAIRLGLAINVFWDVKDNRLSIISEEGIHTTISVQLGFLPIKNSEESKIYSDEPLAVPRNLSLKECSQISQEDFVFRGDIAVGETIFPHLFETYGNLFASELGACSEIVGMQIPGLNSLFLKLKFFVSIGSSDCYYKLVNCNLIFGILKIVSSGRYLKSEMDVLYRPSSRNLHSIHTVSKMVKSKEFENVDALIIGGSRGLGAIIAKILISGGGRVTITYNLGIADAVNLQKDIVNFGGLCKILQLNIQDEFIVPEGNFNQIYYFATPKILPESPTLYNSNLKKLYKHFYVDAFQNLLDQILKKDMRASVFYPSTTFIDNPSPKFSNYVDFKLKGELLCRNLNYSGSMRVIHSRLPKLETDQNLSLLPEKFEDAPSILYPIIQKMTKILTLN